MFLCIILHVHYSRFKAETTAPTLLEFSPNTKWLKTFGILQGVWDRSEYNMRQASYRDMSKFLWIIELSFVINVWNFNGIPGALAMLGCPRCDKPQLTAQLSRHNVLSSLALGFSP